MKKDLLNRLKVILKDRLIIGDNIHIPERSEYTIEKNKDNNKLILYNGKHLFSKYNPQREAERIIDKNYKDTKTDKVFILSFGNPYLVKETLSKIKASAVILIEKDIDLLYKAVTEWEIDYLKKYNFHVITGFNTEKIMDTAADFILPTDTVKIIYQNSVIEIHPEYYRDIIKLIGNIISFRKENFETIADLGRTWTEQIIRNISIKRYSYSLNSLINRIKSQNKIVSAVIGAGPSLDKSIGFLKENRKKLLILSADTAFPNLSARGIEPDIIFAGDAKAFTYKHFLEQKRFVNLVAAPIIYPDVLKLQWERVFFFEYPHPFFEITDAFKGEMLKSGGSISIPAFDFAKKIGSEIIFLCGQDYSIKPFENYARGTAYSEAFYNISDKFVSVEHMYKRDLINYKIGDRTFYTMPNLLNYKKYLEYEMKNIASGIKVIDLSDGILEGIEKIDVADASKIMKSINIELDFENMMKECELRKIDSFRLLKVIYNRLLEWQEYLRTDLDRALKDKEIIDFICYGVQSKILELKDGVETGDRQSINEMLRLYKTEAGRWTAYIKEVLHVHG